METNTAQKSNQETWLVDACGKIYEASFEELTEWITEGVLLPDDKVKRGHLRWLPAEKAPELHQFFYQHVTGTLVSGTKPKENISEVFSHFQTGDFESERPEKRPYTLKIASTIVNTKNQSLFCLIHPDREYHYVCTICGTSFCKECPKSYGGNVKICPMCGGMCAAFDQIGENVDMAIPAINKPYVRVINKNETEEAEVKKLETKIHFNDLIEAVANPFRFPSGLIAGTVLLTFAITGISVLALGGYLLIGVAASISFLTLMMTFSTLAKTIENFLHERKLITFMPELKKFTFWEDFIQPVFLGIGVYLVTFGLFVTIAVSAGIYAWVQVSDSLERVETEMRSSHSNLNSKMEMLKGKPEAGGKEKNNIDKKVNETLQNQISDVFGANYLADTQQIEKVIRSFLRLSIFFQMPICFAFILGLIYFPSACSVAASSRSFGKTVNVINGIKTIKKFGFDYIKILLLHLYFATICFCLAMECYFVLSYFEYQFAGLITGLIVGSFPAFYFWLVFSYILGIGLYKKQPQEIESELIQMTES
jgi:hypothetical protein